MANNGRRSSGMNYKCFVMMVMAMMIMGTVVGQSNASFQQCMVRCLRTCVFNVACSFRCGANCILTDPPFHAAAGRSPAANTNLNLCSLGCLAATLADHTRIASKDIVEYGPERVAERVMDGCLSACSSNY